MEWKDGEKGENICLTISYIRCVVVEHMNPLMRFQVDLANPTAFFFKS